MNIETRLMRAHVEAVTELLLGRTRMKPGMVITGGDLLTPDGQRQMIASAMGTETDVVHLAYATTPAAVRLVGIDLYAPRKHLCHVYTGCRFWLGPRSKRAVILPREERRGHFRLAPGELIHLDGKPEGSLSEGVARADQQLLALLLAKRPAEDQIPVTVIDRVR